MRVCVRPHLLECAKGFHVHLQLLDAMLLLLQHQYLVLNLVVRVFMQLLALQRSQRSCWT